MYTKLLEGEIIFYFAHPQLFDNVQHQSAYMCKNIVTKEGEDISERFAITGDEEPMFKLCLDETMPPVTDILKPILVSVEQAVVASITGENIKAISSALSTLNVTDSVSYVMLRIRDNGAYSPSDVPQVDTSLRSAIEQGVISNFYSRVTHPDLTKLSGEMFLGQAQALSGRIIPLRKKTSL